MVKRRKLLIGMGALATGSAAGMGTGALSQMSSGDRSVTVDVVGDKNAYVGLLPGDDGGELSPNEFQRDEKDQEYDDAPETSRGDYDKRNPDDGENHGYFVEYHNGKLTLDFGKAMDHPGGEGINRDSVYYFDEVFYIRNQSGGDMENRDDPGVGTLDVWITEDIPGITFYTGSMDTGSITPLNAANKVTGLAPSNYVGVGVEIVADDLPVEIKGGTMAVHAQDSNPSES